MRSPRLPQLVRTVVMITILLSTVAVAFAAKPLFFKDYATKPLLWQKPVQKADMTVINGSTQADFGSFQIYWALAPKKAARLMTLESSGSGELPPRPKPVLLWVRSDGTTLLFKEWLPLLNEIGPTSLRSITCVSTKTLFSVIPDDQSPAVSPLSKKTASIRWKKFIQKDGAKYLPGSLKTTAGRFDLSWKKVSGHMPEFIAITASSNGGPESDESALYLWMDPNQNLAAIFQDKILDPSGVAFLQPIAVVSRSKLLAAFRKINNEP
ncbi:MAG TPA: hypothetical protein VHR47_01830 [Bacillota bacterium]|nr:hypothetical protein [Bacillota bacterium]